MLGRVWVHIMRLIIDLIVAYHFLINSGSLATISTSTERYASQREDHPNPNNPICYTGQIEYRLTKLEVQTAERGETLKSELRESNRRLQALEWQNAEVHTALEGLTGELSRFTATGQASHAKDSGVEGPSEETEELGKKLDTLSRGIHVIVAAVKLVNVELKSLKQELSVVSNNTKNILNDYHQLLDKEFFNNALVEVKHRLNVRHVPTNTCHNTTKEKPQDCIDLQKKGKKSGVYKIFPEEYPQGIMALCEMDASGGGWTVIQNRYDGSQNFFLNWHNYKHGFGNLGGEFWLGLDNIYHLTGHEVNELRIELIDHTSTKKYAHYGAFSVGSEMEGYSLKLLSGYQGDAGDSLSYHAGSRFSTKDMDQDSWEEGSCAKSHVGAWWYKACDTSNLNGNYLNGELADSHTYQGMYWGDFRGAQYSLRQARMMVRPADKVISEERN